MNPPNFTSSSTTYDPKSFIEKLKKVFEVMIIADAERVYLAYYQLKIVARTLFDQWKKGFFKEAFLGHFSLRELKEAKVREFLTFKKEYA